MWNDDDGQVDDEGIQRLVEFIDMFQFQLASKVAGGSGAPDCQVDEKRADPSTPQRSVALDTGDERHVSGQRCRHDDDDGGHACHDRRRPDSARCRHAAVEHRRRANDVIVASIRRRRDVSHYVTVTWSGMMQTQTNFTCHRWRRWTVREVVTS